MIHLKIDNTYLQGKKYKLVRFIASGGFGCTYEAEHVMLHRRVAIKEFFVKDFCNRDEMSGTVSVATQGKEALIEKLKRKFMEEACALAEMQHPNIVRVIDVFEEHNTAYYVMDYIEGQTLGEMVQGGALPETMAVRYIEQVAEALRYVHNRHRTHLDIKPDNIMVDDTDNAVLIDFGVSKQYDEEGGANTSSLVGKTIGYAPPEQMGNAIQSFYPATDIYALGATMYKVLTGVTPPNSMALSGGDAEVEPLPPHISQATRNAVEQSMRLRRKERPQDIEAFLHLLHARPVSQLKTGTDAELKPIPRISVGTESAQTDVNTEFSASHQEKGNINPYRNRWLIAACALVAAILTVLVIVLLQSSDETTETVDGIICHNEGLSFTYSGEVNKKHLPDGQGVGVYANGTYTGSYKNGRREGEGVFANTQEQYIFTGTFATDFFRQGRLMWLGGDEDSSYYEGTFRGGCPYNGTWYDKDGRKLRDYKKGLLL